MQISEENAQELSMHERRVAQTRGALTETVSELQDRLSPGALAGNAGNAVKDATVGRSGRFLGDLGDRIKQNPVPAALVGAGLAWMWMSGRSKNGGNGSYYYQRGLSTQPRTGMSKVGDQVSGTASRVGDQVSGTASRVGDQVSGTVSSVTDQVSGKVSDAADLARAQMNQVATQVQNAGSSVQQMLQQNPLPVALAAAGVGALIATAVPTTGAEQRVMEPIGQQLADQARTIGDKVGQVAQQAQNAARQEAQRQNLS